jgi:proteasome lid subunit RPN8/RPN11
MPLVHIPPDVRAELERWIATGYPHETCGLMIGTQDGDAVKVRRVVQAANLNEERAHDRYELDPQAMMTADAAARAEGLDVVGVWHSHPDHPARPSETDRSKAWEGWSYVIVSVTEAGVADLRSWRLYGDTFAEESVTSEEEPS